MKRTVTATCVLAGTSLLVFALLETPDFHPPTAEEQTAAVGRLDGLPLIQQRAFAITDDFVGIRKPAPNDWLAAHREVPQTFDGFLWSNRNIPASIAGAIYVQPLGEFKEGDSPPLEDLREYAAAFFGLPVKMLTTAPLAEEPSITRRQRGEGWTQYLTGDILSYLKRHVSKDAFCLIGVTMEDLYPADSWNFVFGQATYKDRVGVFSFHRYTPKFHGEPSNDDTKRLMLRRSCHVLTHETGHMFGISHCTFFECTMCGSNHMKESDSRPMHFCPVCLRKLHSSTRFDIVVRYQNLLAFCEKHGFADEAQWTRKVLARLAAL